MSARHRHPLFLIEMAVESMCFGQKMRARNTISLRKPMVRDAFLFENQGSVRDIFWYGPNDRNLISVRE